MRKEQWYILLEKGYTINTCYTSIGHSNSGIDAYVKSELEGGAKTLHLLPLP